MPQIESISPLAPTAASNAGRSSDDKAAQTAVEFEAVFLGMVVNEMLQYSAPKTMNGGHGEEMFRSYLGNEIGREMAESGGIGIATSVEQALRAYAK